MQCPKHVRVAFVLVVSTFAGHGFGENASLPPVVVEEVLAQKWENVREALTADDIRSTVPSQRFLTAHACLATNRNNEALLLFLSLRDPIIAAACIEWATWCVGVYPNRPIALYLYGDALARAGRTKEALTAFDRALAEDPKCVLAFNARGVSRAVIGDLDGALMDLAVAAQLRPDFADTHANLGTLWVLRSAAPGAMEAFSRALAINPDFALAYNGLGCALFGKGDYDDAVANLEKAFTLCPRMLPAGANEALVLAALLTEALPTRVNMASGMTVQFDTKYSRTDLASLRDDQFAKVVDADPIGVARAAKSQQAPIVAALQDSCQRIQRYRGSLNTANRIDLTLKVLDIASTAWSLTSGTMGGWEGFMKETPVAIAETTSTGSFGMNARLSPIQRSSAEFGTRLAAGVFAAGSLQSAPIIAFSSAVSLIGQEAAGKWANASEEHVVNLHRDAVELSGRWRALQQRAEISMSVAINRGTPMPDLSYIDLAAVTALSVGRYQSLIDRQYYALSKGFSESLEPAQARAAFGLNQAFAGKLPIAPVREYSIAASAPLAAFGTLPGATGKSISPPAQRSFVLIDGAVRTDPVRLGAVVRGYEALGAEVVPIPKGMDTGQWMKTLGLPSNSTVVMRIVDDVRVPGKGIPQVPGGYSSRSDTPPPGGVTFDMSHARIDRGKWPVMIAFTLAYSVEEDKRTEQ